MTLHDLELYLRRFKVIQRNQIIRAANAFKAPINRVKPLIKRLYPFHFTVTCEMCKKDLLFDTILSESDALRTNEYQMWMRAHNDRHRDSNEKGIGATFESAVRIAFFCADKKHINSITSDMLRYPYSVDAKNMHRPLSAAEIRTLAQKGYNTVILPYVLTSQIDTSYKENGVLPIGIGAQCILESELRERVDCEVPLDSFINFRVFRNKDELVLFIRDKVRRAGLFTVDDLLFILNYHFFTGEVDEMYGEMQQDPVLAHHVERWANKIIKEAD